MIGGVSYLDTALLAVVAISGLVAMYRGLTREVLSILSWIAAAGACVYFVFNYRKEAEQLAQQFGAPVLVAQVAVGGLIFLVVLIIVHLITSRISDTVLDSRVGAIDRILGLLFGVARGFVLVVIPFMFYESFVDKPEQQYPWVREAVSRPYIEATGRQLKVMLQRMVPSSLMGQPEQQQGTILLDHHRRVASASGKRRQVVIYAARPTLRTI
jgi:membrane protein required for colicin V production